MTSPERIAELLQEDERRELIEDLLEQNQNEWDGSDSLEDLMQRRYAVIIRRHDDGWVVGADNLEDIARCILSTLQAEWDVEWVDAVVNLETSEQTECTSVVTVTVTGRDGNSVSVSDAAPS